MDWKAETENKALDDIKIFKAYLMTLNMDTLWNIYYDYTLSLYISQLMDYPDKMYKWSTNTLRLPLFM